ncbi:MAG: DUF1538 domain-containing protein, partial [Deltaproteobacteria bacterium]|nr:DUF1538 domain-containing protein [Deltaproteobacteria bacterium]
MHSHLAELIKEVLWAVLPISIVVCILQITLLHMPMDTFIRFALGALYVSVGLFLFLVGVKSGLLPMGETIGAALPQKGSVVYLVVMAFILGTAVTVAEPDVRVLAHQVDFVSHGLVSRNILVFVVALSVGICVAGAVLRIILGVSIVRVLMVGYAVILILSFFTPDTFLPIAYDAGGVTTGPVTVPFIIALGLGTVGVLRGKSSFGDGFG